MESNINSIPDNSNTAVQSEKIPRSEQIIYGAADLFGGGQAAMLSVILLAFFTDIVGIGASIAGTIITLSKLWDAISDPSMGIISDNTRLKLGRRKPYMILGGILIPFGLAMLFAPIQSWGNTPKVIWMVFAYIIYCTISTVSQVPYTSMSSDISPDYRERNSANTWKLIFDIIASALFYLIPTILWGMVDKPNSQGSMPYTSFYLIIVLGIGLVFALPLIIAGFTVKERVQPLAGERARFNFKTFFEGLKVKSYIWHIIMYVCAFLTMDMVSAITIYYTNYIAGALNGVVVFAFLGDLGKMGSIWVIAPMMVCAGIGILISYRIKSKHSKQMAYRAGLPLYILGAILLACYQQSWNAPWLVPIFSAIAGFGFAGAQSMPWLIFPDTVDVAELKLGYRPTANMSGMMTFARKVSTAFGVGMVGWVLGWAGYDGLSDTQPDSAILAIRLLLALSVLILLTIAFIISLKYKVTNAKLDKIRYFNDKIKKNPDKSTLTDTELEEYERLKKELC